MFVIDSGEASVEIAVEAMTEQQMRTVPGPGTGWPTWAAVLSLLVVIFGAILALSACVAQTVAPGSHGLSTDHVRALAGDHAHAPAGAAGSGSG